MEGFLSTKEAIDKYIAGCQAKAQLSNERLFGKAILAGIMIGMGAAASSVAAHTIADVGLARLAAAVVFPVGLMMVILLGAELFTGDCLMAMGVSAGKNSIKDVVRVLVMVYFGNFVGASLLAVLIAMSNQLDYSAGMLGAYTIKVAVGKAGISFSKAVVSGILCNILVCAAVLMALCAKDVTGKLLASFFTIMLFVTAGFEHCVANMYYITAGLLAKTNSAYVELAMEKYGYTSEQLAVLNAPNYIFGNLVPVTIGNILGGILFLGLPMFYLNKEKAEAKEKDTLKEGMNNDVVYQRGVAGTGN
ncbi:MAG: formate/nitrite transporter family protein [Lachnospiraceae bacterium]|nr:formate/nitrite transporter family protein [Lachnospiraceae bacterium]